MIPLETLSTLLSVGETELIEELIIALLASPQLALFLKSFRAEKALLRDVPRWRAEINAELKATPVPATLAEEFQLFQRVQLLSDREFSHQLNATLQALESLPSPFLDEANRLLQHTDISHLSSAQHQLFYSAGG